MNIYKSIFYHHWLMISRNVSRNKNLLNIFVKVMNIIFIESLIFLCGFYFIPVLQSVTNADPAIILNQFIYMILLSDLIIRSIVKHKIPSFLPYLTLNIRKKTLAHCILLKRMISIPNLSYCILIVPIAFQFFVPVYGLLSALHFLICMILIAVNISILSLYIKLLSEWLIQLFLILITLISLIQWLIHPIKFSAKPILLDIMLSRPFTPVILTIYLITGILLCRYHLKNRLYVDSTNLFPVYKNKLNIKFMNKIKSKSVLQYLNVCLLLRNRRPRSLLKGTIFLILFTICALALFTLFLNRRQDLNESEPWVLLMIFIIQSAGFIIFEGLFFLLFYNPFFEGLMTRPIQLSTIFHNQYYLYISSVIILSLISLPLLLILNIHILTFLLFVLYNVGINSLVILFLSTFNIAKANLNKSIAFNYEGYGFLQYFAMWAVIIIPAGIYTGLKNTLGKPWTFTIFALFSIAGIVFHRNILSLIIKRTAKHKYRMIALFNGNEV